MYERSYLQILKKRILEQRSFIQVVSGPRQVGKTTLVVQMIRQLPFDTLLASADDVPAADRFWIRSVWSEARLKLQNSSVKDFLLVIDEIQKIDNWSESVKKEWDDDTLVGRNLKVILMGSSSLLIQKGLTESLAGRFENIYLTHWTYPEMKAAFNWNINQYIWFGGYPGSAKLISEEYRWKDYIKDSLIETSISKDVLMLTRVDKPPLLKRLFEIGCTFSSQIVSLNKVQGELQEKGNLTTLANYLHLLEGAGLLTGLEKYAGNIIHKRSSKPKFQVFNNALMSAQSNLTFEKVVSEPGIWGRMTESAVGAFLLNASIDHRFNLFYWNESHNELDFVLEKNGLLVGIEVKSGKDSGSRGMSLFYEKFHPYRLYIVGTGGIPVEEFIQSDAGTFF